MTLFVKCPLLLLFRSSPFFLSVGMHFPLRGMPSATFFCQNVRMICRNGKLPLSLLRKSIFNVMDVKRIIECVPNFSEGRNPSVIDGIVSAIASAEADGEKVKVLNVDPGEGANRTVVTFVGSPEAVCEAAFRGVEAAGRLIDMRQQHGTHPRSGATDVLPLIPISGVTLDECAVMARSLAERIYKVLGIACYCYEAAAFTPARRDLAYCRSGEYEALPERFADPAMRPDFGPDEYDERVAISGASIVGARNYLIAVNFNLNTTSVPLASAIACDVRQRGRKARKNDDPKGEILRDAEGNDIWIRGTLKGCKAIGWYIEEYGIAQVSMNITDIEATPLHKAYEEVCRAAAARGAVVTGTELIGLVPKRVLVDAGRYFLAKNTADSTLSKKGKNADEKAVFSITDTFPAASKNADVHPAADADSITDEESIAAAVRAMSLDDLRPFEPRKKIIEYLMEDIK